jgi:hypothetical protein
MSNPSQRGSPTVSAAPGTPGTPGIPKCCCRGCSKTDEVPLPCQGPGCRRYFHLSCFKEKYHSLHFNNLEEGQIVCKKKCGEKLEAVGVVRCNWKNDGADGPNDPQTSERILLDWLLVPGNYSLKWKGKDNKGENKTKVAKKIAALMNDANVKVARDEKQVQNKIKYLEKAFKKANDWTTTVTGAGLQENDKGSFDDSLLRMCPYYFDLLPIFGDRASAKPKATSNDNLSSSFDSEDDYDDGSGLPDDLAGDSESLNHSLDGVEENSIMASDEMGAIATKSEPAKAAKKRTRPPSISPTLSKSNHRITMLGPEANQKMAALAETKEKLAQQKLQKLQRAEKEDAQRSSIELRMFKINQLKQLRRDNPNMTDEEIVQLFPEFAAIVKLVR